MIITCTCISLHCTHVHVHVLMCFNIYIFTTQGLDHSAMINYEQNMQDAIAIFPRLLTGLDVNVSFNRLV